MTKLPVHRSEAPPGTDLDDPSAGGLSLLVVVPCLNEEQTVSRVVSGVPRKITGIERDVQLSESVLRVLIMRADYMTEDDMKAAYVIRSQPAGHGHGRGDREGRRFGGGSDERRRPRDERESPPRTPDAEKSEPATTVTAEPDEKAGKDSEP